MSHMSPLAIPQGHHNTSLHLDLHWNGRYAALLPCPGTFGSKEGLSTVSASAIMSQQNLTAVLISIMNCMQDLLNVQRKARIELHGLKLLQSAICITNFTPRASATLFKAHSAENLSQICSKILLHPSWLNMNPPVSVIIIDRNSLLNPNMNRSAVRIEATWPTTCINWASLYGKLQSGLNKRASKFSDFSEFSVSFTWYFP